MLVTAFFSVNLHAQDTKKEDKSARPSPPATASATVDGVQVTIDYSSPGVKDRRIWGDLVPYDKVWRTGANEATTLTVSKDVKIEGQPLKAGKYSLFTIPGRDEWTVIINAVWDQWGAYNYDASRDVMRFTVKPEKTDTFYERLKFEIEKDGEVDMNWENLEISFDISGT